MTHKKLDPTDEITVHGLVEGEHRGWVHTHGMAAHGKPELEVFVSPVFMIPYAFELLNNVADYVLNGDNTPKSGELGVMGQHKFRFQQVTEPLRGEEGHYQVPVLRLVDTDVKGPEVV